MTYNGHIKNGQVVLDEPAELPEGAAVAVEVPEALTSRRGSAQLIVGALTPWDGQPGELDQLLTEIQQLRDADVLPTREELK